MTKDELKERLEAKLDKVVKAQPELVKQAQAQLERLAGAEAVIRELLAELVEVESTVDRIA